MGRRKLTRCDCFQRGYNSAKFELRTDVDTGNLYIPAEGISVLKCLCLCDSHAEEDSYIASSLTDKQ